MLSAEAAAPSARVFALVTGTMGLLAVGVLLLTVTPPKQDSPIALSASTTLVRSASPTSGPTGALVNPGAPADEALATPIGDGRLALVTRAALGEQRGTTVSVRLTSGRVGLVEVVDRSDGALVLVALPAGEAGHPIADELPDADEIVTVLASPPITVPFADVATLEVEEGTPVFDQEGALVGLCSRGKGILLAPPDEHTDPEPPNTTSPEPTTTLVATTVTPSTTATTTTTTTTLAPSTTTTTVAESTVSP